MTNTTGELLPNAQTDFYHERQRLAGEARYHRNMERIEEVLFKHLNIHIMPDQKKQVARDILEALALDGYKPANC